MINLQWLIWFFRQTRWNEVIDTMPYIMQEVLFAWENGAINVDQIQVSNKLTSKELIQSLFKDIYYYS